MKTLFFVWHYITKPYFRAWIHAHDLKRFYDHIENERRQMLEHQFRSIYGDNADAMLYAIKTTRK